MPPPAFESDLTPEVEAALSTRLREAATDRVVERIWRRDAGLWGGGPEIADRLGWLTIVEPMREQVGALERLREECVGQGLTDAVLLGMGGSSLAPEVMRRSFGAREGALRLHVLDSTDPEAILKVERAVDLERTLFVVSTKSGGTVETLSLFRHFHARLGGRLEGSELGQRFVAVTDPGSGLERLATEAGFRRVFRGDPEIGGRYSALSLFGLVPAALMGADVTALLDGAEAAAKACAGLDGSPANPGLWLGCLVAELALRGRDKLTFVAAEPVGSFGLWAEQLVAESLGKQGRGVVPVADEPVGAPATYGTDRVFVLLRPAGKSGAAPAPELVALAEAGHPVVTAFHDGPGDLGRVFFLSEFAVAVAGWALAVNPFDQPNVQEAKDNTARVLEGYVVEGRLRDDPEAGEGALDALLAQAAPPRYVALMAYLAPSDALDRAVSGLRAAIRDATGAATTFGYGPRFLHSTGQLHKGGPPSGLFLQLLHDGAQDLDVPEAGYTFGTLEHAQAAGDLETLRAHGLTVERIRLEGDPVAAVEALRKRVRSAAA